MQIPVLCSCSRGGSVACAQTSHPDSQCAVSGLSGTCGTGDAGGAGALWLSAFALSAGWMRNPVSSATHFPDVPCKQQSYSSVWFDTCADVAFSC